MSVIDEKAESLYREVLSTRPGRSLDSRHEGLLVGSMDQLYAARAAFKDDAHHAITVLAGSVAGSGYLLIKGIDVSGNVTWTDSLFVVCGVLAFLVTAYASSVYRGILESGYSLYATAAINAAVVWRSCCGDPVHTWLIQACKIAEESKGRFCPSPDGWESSMLCDVLLNSNEENEEDGDDNEDKDDNKCRSARTIPELVALWKAHRRGSLMGQHEPLIRTFQVFAISMALVGVAVLLVRYADSLVSLVA